MEKRKLQLLYLGHQNNTVCIEIFKIRETARKLGRVMRNLRRELHQRTIKTDRVLIMPIYLM